MLRQGVYDNKAGSLRCLGRELMTLRHAVYDAKTSFAMPRKGVYDAIGENLWH
jgi:hypothetical protein